MATTNIKPITLDQAEKLTEDIIMWLNLGIEHYEEHAYIERALMENVRVCLNKLIKSDNISCTELFTTNNFDKQMFGTYILPTIDDFFICSIVEGELEKVTFHEFRMELDTGLFNGDYNPKEILAMMLADIYGVMDPNVPERIRTAIDACVCNTGRAASGYIIKNVQKKHELAILRYVFVSFLRNLYTFAGDDQIMLPYGSDRHVHVIQALGLENTIYSIYKDRIVSLNGGINPGSEINMFRWAFDLLDDISMHFSDAIDTLSTIKSMTGSKLEQNLVTHAIECLKSGIDMDVADKYVKESHMLMEFSLFKSLKINGLRGIEDDLFEYKIRIKNCEDEEDAMYILRQINTRLTILDDYIRNESGLSNSERARWQSCIDSYRDLRYQLGQKKIGSKKQYGIFIDYDKLDQL